MMLELYAESCSNAIERFVLEHGIERREANLNGASESLSRRQLLQLSAVSPLVLNAVLALVAQEPKDHNKPLLLSFVESCRRGGGYGFGVDHRAHITATFAGVGIYRLLGIESPNKNELADAIRNLHPFTIKKLEREMHTFEYQQIQSLLWLGEDVSSFRDIVAKWTMPLDYPATYEMHRYPIFHYELMTIICRQLLGMSLDLPKKSIDYLASRRRENGSYNNTPASDGTDGHVGNTYWGLRAEIALKQDHERETLIDWLQNCQSKDGGFCWQPKPSIAKKPTVFHTWAAIKSLEMIGGSLRDKDACVEWLLSTQNIDGGFGSQSDWLSSIEATYYAVDASAGLGRQGLTPKKKERLEEIVSINSVPDLKVFSIQIEAPGKGSPQDTVNLASSLKIDLWAAKNAESGWIEEAQRIADREGVSTKFCIGNEEYGTFVTIPGMGSYSHLIDLVAESTDGIGPSMASKESLTWESFQEGRLDRLNTNRAIPIWQFNENEFLTRMLLDVAADRGGYGAISTFHFGNPDFTNSEPFLQTYRGRIPFIALLDAHGVQPWWFADQVSGMRTLFIAKEPTWEGFLGAMKANRIVAVRHDEVTKNETWVHAPSDRHWEYVKAQQKAWSWWDDGGCKRPLASIAVITKDSKFEGIEVTEGAVVRIRLQRRNTTQGRPKEELVRLKSVTIDGEEIEMKLVQETDKAKGALIDIAYVYTWADASVGEHLIKVSCERIEDGYMETVEKRVRIAE